MKFNQYKNGSADMVFSWRERFKLFFYGRLRFTDTNLKHIGNNLVNIVSTWHSVFRKDLQQLHSDDKTKIEAD